MRNLALLLSVIALASCASAPTPHGRGGGYHRGGGEREGMPFGGPQMGASAPRPPRPGADPDAVLIAGFDENFDLVINQNELTDGITREFARADTDHDRSISHSEFEVWSERAFGGAYPPHWLAFDADGDGRISAAEFSAELHAIAARDDANHDGVIDHSELVQPDIARAETADAAITDDDPRPIHDRPPQR